MHISSLLNPWVNSISLSGATVLSSGTCHCWGTVLNHGPEEHTLLEANLSMSAMTPYSLPVSVCKWQHFLLRASLGMYKVWVYHICCNGAGLYCSFSWRYMGSGWVTQWVLKLSFGPTRHCFGASGSCTACAVTWTIQPSGKVIFFWLVLSSPERKAVFTSYHLSFQGKQKP